MIALVFVFLIHIFSPVSSDNKIIQQEISADGFPAAKTKFIVFSGSDWCKGCIQFRKKVLSDPAFESFAKDNLDIIVADFPQRAKLAREMVEVNEALAEKYNPKGVFPNLVLVSADGSHTETITYINQTPQEFLNELKSRLQHLNG